MSSALIEVDAGLKKKKKTLTFVFMQLGGPGLIIKNCLQML